MDRNAERRARYKAENAVAKWVAEERRKREKEYRRQRLPPAFIKDAERQVMEEWFERYKEYRRQRLSLEAIQEAERQVMEERRKREKEYRRQRLSLAAIQKAEEHRIQVEANRRAAAKKAAHTRELRRLERLRRRHDLLQRLSNDGYATEDDMRQLKELKAELGDVLCDE